MIRVLVVSCDSQKLVGCSVRSLLTDTSHIEVVGDVTSLSMLRE